MSMIGCLAYHVLPYLTSVVIIESLVIKKVIINARGNKQWPYVLLSVVF